MMADDDTVPILSENDRDDGFRRRVVASDENGEQVPRFQDAVKTSFTLSDAWRDFLNDPGFYFIISVVAFVQGSMYLSGLAIAYFFKDDLAMQPYQTALANAVQYSPWMIKPIYGFISDSYPIFGYRRSPYFVIFGIVGCLAWELLAYGPLDSTYAISIIFVTSLSVAFVNVLAEALIVEKGGKHQSDIGEVRDKITFLMTLYWGIQSVTKIFAGFFSGYLLQVLTRRDVFFICGFFPAVLFFIACALKEQRIVDPPAIETQWSRLWTHVKHPFIWQPAIFMFVFMATPSAQTAQFYFLTNDLKFQPEFMGILQVVEGVSSLVGLFIYHAFCSRIAYRSILKWAIVIALIAGLTPLILVLHWNRNWGWGDRWFAVTDTAILAGVGQVAMMPVLVLAAQTCPKSVEGTLYAFLMSIINIGSLTSDALGGLLTYLFGVTATDFGSLWLLILVCDLCNFIPIPMLWCFIPTEEQLEDFHERKRRDALT